MSDSTTQNLPNSPSLASILRDVEPMGDLASFVIGDLSPAEEEEFYSILEGA